MSKLFAKVISRRQNLPLERKELNICDKVFHTISLTFLISVLSHRELAQIWSADNDNINN